MSRHYYKKPPFTPYTESVQLLGRVLDTISEQPSDVAQAAMLRHLGGYEHEEVAKIMGIETEEAARLACNGLKRLKEANIIKLTNKQKRV